MHKAPFSWRQLAVKERDMRNLQHHTPRPAAHKVQSFIDFSLAWLDERRYTLTVDADLGGWVTIMRTTVGAEVINPSFDPDHSLLTAQNSFWLDIRAGSETIAVSAARLLVTDDMTELMRSMRLWYTAPTQKFEIFLTSPIPLICGRVGYEGGLWVHPRHRGHGLSVILPHLNRALCHRQWSVEWQTGLVHRSLAESDLTRRAYGFPRIVQCSAGYFPVTRKVDPLYLVYLSEAELLRGLDVDTVTRLPAYGNGQVRDPVARVQKR
jgi:hypothetical protein